MTAEARVAKGMWWDRAWGLVQGCTKVSAGCTHCWAEREAHMHSCQKSEAMQYRFGGVTDPTGKWAGDIRLLWDNMGLPLKTFRPQTWAVWNDLFHHRVPGHFVQNAYRVMAEAPQHTYILLTKRADRMRGFQTQFRLQPKSNEWLGVTAENQEWADKRIPVLLRTPAAVRFVSLEPLLGPVDFVAQDYDLDWLIVGAESGPGRRPCKIGWVRDIVGQCKAASVPVFVKQLNIDGRVSKDMAEWPEDLRVRQFPEVTG